MRKSYFLILSIFFFGLLANSVFAKTDVSISETDITFSKVNIFDGDTVRIYARVFNLGDTDVFGYVDFMNDSKEIASPQPISLKPNTYDDVFVDWKPIMGQYNIKAKIIGLTSLDENLDNNITTKKDIFVDLDTDHDGIGDSKDTDNDGDTVLNDQEIEIGTNPLKADTDSDEVNDGIDVFPIDKTEWRDTDKDGVGDNKDPDIDNDGISNQDEMIKYGTNLLHPDTDEDSINDSEEIKNGTDPNVPNKSALKIPSNISFLDFTKLKNQLPAGENKRYWYIGFGVLAVIILLFLFRKKRKKR